MSVIHTPRKPELDARLLAFPAVMGSLLGVLFLRLWYFQVVKASELQERADASRQKPIAQPAPRGLIYDRNGLLVAGVRPEITVTVKPAEIKKNPWIIDKLAEILKVDPKRLTKKLAATPWPGQLPMPIYTGASIEAGTRIAEAGDDLPGVSVETQAMRYYPDSTSFTHVLGYVGMPDQKELTRIVKAGLTPPEYVGKAGVEKSFETDLMGAAGAEYVEIDAKQHPLRVVGRDNAIPGKQLVLSLDANLQKFATDLMAKNKYVGGIAAVDPSNGEILCLVSSPTFDQNLFDGGISTDDWTALQGNPSNPMMDRAIAGTYSPGSTFKVVTTLAAYETGKFDPNMRVSCDGGYKIGRRFIRCLGHHGSINFRTALEKSCNVYFNTLGRAVGEDALRKAALELGLNEKTGIEIGQESAGLVPTEEWVAKHRKPPTWYVGDTLNFSIGQGETRATPLQMANLYAQVGNNGTSYRPHLVRALRNPVDKSEQPVKPQILHEIAATPEFWAVMREALVNVVDHGTAQRGKISGVEWAGKTGSTEFQHGKKTHAWFVGFAPAEQPKIAICVLIEDAGHGGDFSAPIAKEIVQRYLDSLKPKAPSANSLTNPSASAALSGKPIAR